MEDTVHWTMTQVLGIILFVFSLTILIFYYNNFIKIENVIIDMPKDEAIIDLSYYKEGKNY